jgi:hypothetical protein
MPPDPPVVTPEAHSNLSDMGYPFLIHAKVEGSWLEGELPCPLIWRASNSEFENFGVDFRIGLNGTQLITI